MIYFILKRIISNGFYEKEEISRKLVFYFQANRITREEFDELTALMD
ncbi:hypothetical protein [Youxingia wuxianensis]|uniref:Uncharacterized protein n=1 Tax=Youxingia wuxianensis TaxID=2763678 RepID=A0A926IG33_9FIRM|nr:hypothetical protein [Youxingia wuxianensis]MBC8584459.1 hypothetical protein [Youxingia wuxianensis]